MTEPDPVQVLKEAEAAAKAGRYEEALEKHVWYHENALRIRPSQAGVRLSYAIFAWRRLGNRYPPALEKFRAVRDATAELVRENQPNSDLFSDIVTFNDILEDPQRTVELFRWLDANKPDKAKWAYWHALPVLVEYKEYALCGKYLKPKLEFEIAVSSYNAHQRIVERHETEGRAGQADALRYYERNSFSNSICTMVALLVLNDRKQEAAEYAAKAKEILDDAEFHASVDKAFEGVVPERWPPIDRRLWEEVEKDN